MKAGQHMLSWKIILAGITGFGISLAGLWFSWNSRSPHIKPPVLFWVVSILESIGVAVLIAATISFLHQQRQMKKKLFQTENRLDILQREMNGIMQINRTLMTAPDEKQLVEAALSMIQNVVSAIAVSFVPMDDWGVPLPAFSQGQLPRAVLTAWAEHLTSPRVRHACRVCQQMEARQGEKCPALEGPFAGQDVHCLPVRRGERMLGMLNLYLPSGSELDPELERFINETLGEIGQAIESFRLRARELDALRFYQQDEASEPEMNMQLSAMIKDLLPLLDAEALLIRIEPPWMLQSSPWIRTGSAGGLEMLDRWVNESAHDRDKSRSVDLRWQERIQVNPICFTDGTVIGELCILLHGGIKFDERRKSGIQHLARQIGLILDMERLHKALKFQAVIQERNRLAREIHDSLAQTLSFLKLTTARMQNYLGEGDYPRLNQAIKESYQALTEAYADTRKAIDDLRFAPLQKLPDWLEQLAHDFEQENGISVRLRISTDSLELPSEIQVQLMRIIQEALNNVRKHAQAHQVKLDVRQWNHDLIIQIQDNGKGFQPEEVPEYSRYGLRGMRERSEAIGADFQVISKPGQGTTISIRLPVPHQEVQD